MSTSRLSPDALTPQQPISQLVVDVLHLLMGEMRGPFTSINQSLPKLRDLLDAEAYADATQETQRLLGESERLLSVLDLLLNMMRENKVKLLPSLYTPHKICQLVLAAVAPASEAAKVTLQVDIAPEAPKLTADERLLIQSLVCCCELALEATSLPGTITLEVVAEPTLYHFRLHDPRPYPPETLATLQRDFATPLRVLLQQRSAMRVFLSRFILRAHGGLLQLLPSGTGGVTFDLSIPRPERMVPVILQDASPLFEET